MNTFSDSLSAQSARNNPGYLLTAWRRQGGVLIRGTVLGPPGAEPYLIPSPSKNSRTLAFRLAFRDATSQTPHVPLQLEHFVPSLGYWIDTLQIDLPTENSYIIERQTRAPLDSDNRRPRPRRR